MAGKEVYIGRMIEGLQISIDKQVQEMEQVAGILADMAANYGVTVQQKAFSRESLKAVPLISYNIRNFTPAEPPPTKFITGPDSARGTNGAATKFEVNTYIDLTDTVSITAEFRHSKNVLVSSNDLSILIDNNVYWTGQGNKQTPVNGGGANIEGAYSGIHKVTFSGYTGDDSTDELIISDMQFVQKNGEVWPAWQDSDLLEYNTAGALGMKTSSEGYGYGFIDFPAQITGEIATWVSLIFQATTLDGVNLSIVDANGNLIRGDLIEKNAIGDLTVFDFYIKFEFTNPNAEITGVILRYT